MQNGFDTFQHLLFRAEFFRFHGFQVIVECHKNARFPDAEVNQPLCPRLEQKITLVCIDRNIQRMLCSLFRFPDHTKICAIPQRQKAADQGDTLVKVQRRIAFFWILIHAPRFQETFDAIL